MNRVRELPPWPRLERYEKKEAQEHHRMQAALRPEMIRSGKKSLR